MTVDRRQHGLGPSMIVDLLRTEHRHELVQAGECAVACAGLPRHGDQTEVRRRDDGRHLDHELHHVDDEHAPQAGMRREHHIQDAEDEDRLPRRHREEDIRDLARRERDRAHDEAVEKQSEVDGAEPTHHRGRLPGIAQLVELEIRHHAGTPPQPREEEDGGHAREHEGPPLPVACDAVLAHLLRHPVRCVAAECRRHHREPGKPPRHRAAGREELGRAAARALPEEQRGNEADQQRGNDDDPVEKDELHSDGSLIASGPVALRGESRGEATHASQRGRATRWQGRPPGVDLDGPPHPGTHSSARTVVPSDDQSRHSRARARHAHAHAWRRACRRAHHRAGDSG